jgi:ABC-type nitrate/sulfonate/bicarbonate transport system substrate-binding protein
MSSQQTSSSPVRPAVKIAPNNPVFDLPVLVAIEEGLFERAGLDVSMPARYEDREKTLTERDVLARLKEQMFECGSADSYNVCEWASIDRLERGQRGGNIAALRAAVVAQAILSFEDALQTPRDLAGVPVAVNELTGSHYTTLQMLEGAVGRQDVKIVHIGAPQKRLEALRDRTHRAVTVMEPFISLGLKLGAHIIAAEFYRGGEVIAPSLTPEQRQAYYAAENQAVDLINADFDRYAHHIVAAAGGALKPEELLRVFFRYKHVDYYEPELFGRTYEWMKSWGLTPGQSEHATLVVD